MLNQSKVEVLSLLTKVLKRSIVNPFFSFSVNQWYNNQTEIISQLRSFFNGDQIIIIRSSASDEDNTINSLAGHYCSVPNVHSQDTYQLCHAIDRVINSYKQPNRSLKADDMLIAQLQLCNVTKSGVILTREFQKGLPYYVINFDDQTSKTNIVTSGGASKALWIAKWQNIQEMPNEWQNIILSIQEIENIYPHRVLAIEFASDINNNVHIFQVREIHIRNPISSTNETSIEYKCHAELISQLKDQFCFYGDCSSVLPGDYTIFSDMSDWNPAEIIGSRPNNFDYSLYRYLVTQSVWNEARVSLNYIDVSPFELMQLIGDKPYIDTRVCFNSLTPANLNQSLRPRLINYYLNKLRRSPQLQDKVEFEVVFTCYDSSFSSREDDLLESGFSHSEIQELKNNLLCFTNNLLKNTANILSSDFRNINNYDNYLNGFIDKPAPLSYKQLFQKSFALLENCRNEGVYIFSRIARLAFVYQAFLRGFQKIDIVDRSFINAIMNSINSITTDFMNDLILLNRGDIQEKEFQNKYGHLRPGMYNIMAQRYDYDLNIFKNKDLSTLKIREKTPLKITTDISSRIERALLHENISCSTDMMIRYIEQTIQYREYSKYIFSKAVSSAIETIVLAFEKLDIPRQDAAMLDISMIKNILNLKNIDKINIRKMFYEMIDMNRKTKNAYERIVLPSVITDSNDLSNVPFYASSPVFVTNNVVEGDVLQLDIGMINCHNKIDGKIVLIENADPGYDWIFARNPRALVTKYGGVASHMAIRCYELSLPAIIGCGDMYFERIKNAFKIKIDGNSHQIITF